MISLTILLAVVGLAASSTFNKVLNFPSASAANYISFDPELPALTGLTVCAWKQDKDNGRSRYWFSYAVPGSDNELILGDAQGMHKLFVKKVRTESSVLPANKVAWVHVCGAWDSETGNAVISINGKAVKTDVVKKGEALTAGGMLVIGQEQDSVGGGFDSKQSYVGNLYNINMWDRALTQAEIASMFNKGKCGIFFAGLSGLEPIISYADILANEIHGDVSVVDGECGPVEIECPPVVGLAASITFNKVLNFPSASAANYISFDPELPALTGLTVCAWKQDKDNGRSRYWFSYAVPGSDNELILGDAQGMHKFFVKKIRTESSVLPANKVAWVYVCGAWDSKTGNAVISINGKAVKTDVVKKGEALTAGGMLVIGQEQDSVGGGFDSKQSYVGNLYNINMWDRALTQAEIASMFNKGMCGIFFAGLSGLEPIISYADILAKEIHGALSLVDGECGPVEIECPPVEECPEKECPVKECPALFCPEKECPITECPAVTCPEKVCPVAECPVVEEVECPAVGECNLPPRQCPGIHPHNPECWKTLEGIRFKDDVSIGHIEGDINAAKAACYASGICEAMTCTERRGAVSCELLTSFGKEKKGAGITSFVYAC